MRTLAICILSVMLPLAFAGCAAQSSNEVTMSSQPKVTSHQKAKSSKQANGETYAAAQKPHGVASWMDKY